MSRRRPERRAFRRYEPLAVLTYIATYQQQHGGLTPSERRIQRALDISAPSVVHMIVQRLERAGLLTITRYGRGFGVAYTLTDRGTEAVQQWQAENLGDEGQGPRSTEIIM